MQIHHNPSSEGGGSISGALPISFGRPHSNTLFTDTSFAVPTEVLLARSAVAGNTYDGPDSPDRDDAIGVRKLGRDYIIDVSIADLTPIAPRGSPLEQLGRERGFSHYYRRPYDHMLPTHVATNSSSLLAANDETATARATISFSFPVSSNYKLGEPLIWRSKMSPDANLLYTDIFIGLKDHKSALHQDHKLLLEIASVLGSERMFGMRPLAAGLLVDEEGRQHRVGLRQAPGMLIVQELMIATNRAFARFAQDEGIPILFRNHTSMDRDSRTLLDASRAHYSPINMGHEALGLQDGYSHFTSPIRRFPDLVNQLSVAAYLDDQPPPFTHDELAVIGHEMSELAMQARYPHRSRFRHSQKIPTLLQSDELTSLPDKLQDEKICLIIREPQVPASLMEVIAQLITDQTLGIKSKAALLFGTRGKTEWDKLRTDLEKSLADSTPSSMKSLLNEGIRAGYVTLTLDERQLSNRTETGQLVTLHCAQKQYHGLSYMKARSIHAAFQNLLMARDGIVEEVDPLGSAAIHFGRDHSFMKVPELPLPTPLEGTDIRDRPHLSRMRDNRETVKTLLADPPIVRFDYLGALKMGAFSGMWSGPRDTFVTGPQTVGSEHLHSVQLKVFVGDKPIVQSSIGLSRSAAKQAAAFYILKELHDKKLVELPEVFTEIL